MCSLLAQVICCFIKLLTSKVMSNQAQITQPATAQPFKILHNFRKKGKQREKPRRKSSACQKHQIIPQFTMRTRKMTAEIELQHELDLHQKIENQEQFDAQNASPEMKLNEDEQFFLQNERQLQNGIPFTLQAEQDILYNLAQNSQMSSYSKLEQALFNFSLERNSMEIE